jgi:hypothetical protein
MKTCCSQKCATLANFVVVVVVVVVAEIMKKSSPSPTYMVTEI